MITRAAIKKGEKIYVGFRHDKIILEQPDDFFIDCTHGFVTSEGEFLDREESAEHAFKCGQIKERADILISEDLW